MFVSAAVVLTDTIFPDVDLAFLNKLDGWALNVMNALGIAYFVIVIVVKVDGFFHKRKMNKINHEKAKEELETKRLENEELKKNDDELVTV